MLKCYQCGTEQETMKSRTTDLKDGRRSVCLCDTCVKKQDAKDD